MPVKNPNNYPQDTVMPFNPSDNPFQGGAANQPQSGGDTGILNALSGVGSGIADVMGDRNIQQFLAQLGTTIDPQGVGGAVGQPTSQMIQRQAQQDFMSKLLNSLGEGASVKMGPDGSIEAKQGKGSGSGSELRNIDDSRETEEIDSESSVSVLRNAGLVD